MPFSFEAQNFSEGCRNSKITYSEEYCGIALDDKSTRLQTFSF